MRVLGIGYLVAHDSNVGVISEDGIEFAVSEERLSRRKRAGTSPKGGLAGPDIGICDVVVAPYCDEELFRAKHDGILDGSRCARFAALQKEHENTLRAGGVAEFVGHHFSHAAGAFYTSGFVDAIAVTYDGGIVCEPWLATVSRGSAGGLEPIRRLTRLDGATAAIRKESLNRSRSYCAHRSLICLMRARAQPR